MRNKKDYSKMSLGEKYTSIYDSFQTIIDNQRFIDEKLKQLNTSKSTRNKNNNRNRNINRINIKK